MSDFWVETFTHKKLYPLQPNPDDICIEDIAHALSLVCRFGGHISVNFYSVSQHSALVAQYIKECGYSNDYILAGLLHDATEGLGFSDICRPVKLQIPEIGIQEKLLEAVVMKKFGVAEKFYKDSIIKKADNKLLITEVRDILQSNNQKGWNKLFGKPLEEHIAPWLPKDAEQEFLRQFKLLTTKQG